MLVKICAVFPPDLFRNTAIIISLNILNALVPPKIIRHHFVGPSALHTGNLFRWVREINVFSGPFFEDFIDRTPNVFHANTYNSV